jgi:glutamate synthase (NADPH/NADH) small chain
MPGYRHEMDYARKEGVRLVEHAVPKAVARVADGRLSALVLHDGRELAADLIVLAIGQAKLGAFASQFAGVAVDPKGRVAVDPATGATGNPKVWAGGDCISAGQEVVNAAQEGKRAARSICASLGLHVRADAPLHAGHR